MDEDMSTWKTKRHQQWLKKLSGQMEDLEMLSTYSPWGRPGCGAPDPAARDRRRQLLKQTRSRGARRFGWGNGSSGGDSGGDDGGGGGGSPSGPQAAAWSRSTNSGGCGAPIKTRSGRIVATRHSDPILLFQPQAPLRRCVEERLRYQRPAESKMAYKRELDELVEQRRRAEAEEYARARNIDRLLGWTGPTDHLKMNGGKSPRERRKNNDPGVELVPLLIQRRIPKKCHLRCTTDITGGRAYWNTTLGNKKEKGQQYLQELNQQVAFKQQKMQAMRAEELASSLRHAERWQQIWSSDPRVPPVPRAARCLGYGGGCLLPRRRYGMGEAVALG